MLSCAVLACLILVSLSSYGSATYTTLMNNGYAASRIDVIVVGEGFTAEDQDAFNVHAGQLNDYLFNQADSPEPFRSYRKFFNFHRVNLNSTESGSDDPTAGVYVDTALNSSYNWAGVAQRLLYVDVGEANDVVNEVFQNKPPNPKLRFAAVNSDQYGGGGGSWAVYSAGNNAGLEIAVHEMGHQFAGLADEYGGSGVYIGGEPNAANITTDVSGAKWEAWMGYVDPDHPELGPIGVYEGAGGFNEGLYRPTQNSKMRNLYRPFDAVSREQFLLSMYTEVSIIDSFRDNSLLLENPTGVWAHPVDPSLARVDWYLNGELIIEDGPSLLVKNKLERYIPYGYHELTAVVTDDSGWIRNDPTGLSTQSVTWDIYFHTPEPGTATMLVSVGFVIFSRRRR